MKIRCERCDKKVTKVKRAEGMVFALCGECYETHDLLLLRVGREYMSVKMERTDTELQADLTYHE